MIERVARSLVCALLERIESGQLTLVEGGSPPRVRLRLPQATVVVRDPAVWPALARGGKGMAETFVDGLWDSPDVTAVIEVAARNLRRDRRDPARAHAGARAVAARPGAPGAQHAACARARTSPPTTTSATTCSS